jgi:hypothetical protein
MLPLLANYGIANPAVPGVRLALRSGSAQLRGTDG